MLIVPMMADSVNNKKIVSSIFSSVNSSFIEETPYLYRPLARQVGRSLYRVGV